MGKPIKLNLFILVLIINCLVHPGKAEINFDFKLSPLFSENAVLQREKTIKIFGTAKPDSKIKLSLANKKSSTKTNKDGTWLITLSPINAGGPYQLKASNEQKTLTVNNIYIGDVWISAGQSNMVWFVDSAKNAEKNIAEAMDYNNKIFFLDLNIRPNEKAFSPFDKLGHAWYKVDSQTVKTLPAVPYAFAREIYNDQKVPIGIIQTATSNTQIQAHMSKESLVGYKDLEKDKAHALEDRIIWYQTTFQSTVPNTAINYFTLCIGEPSHQDDFTAFINDRKVINDFAYANCNKLDLRFLNQINKIQIRVYPTKIKNITLNDLATGFTKSKIIFNGQELILRNWETLPEISANTPSSIFNVKINPITSYPIKGVLWYQGESNVNDYNSYKELFRALVKDWRKRWHEELPFITVQLHNFKTEKPENLLKFREVQSELSTKINKVYMIDAFDLSDEDLDVHPKNKDEVGYRLALIAKKQLYKKSK